MYKGPIHKREYPDQPLIGVGGVVIHENRVLLIQRGAPPFEGTWTIPGGLLELGETLIEAVIRELAEETSLEVQVMELIDVVERIYPDPGDDAQARLNERPRYHFVIADYLCEVRGSGVAFAGSDAAQLAWAAEDELAKFDVTSLAVRVIGKAFAMIRQRAKDSDQEGPTSGRPQP
jgi:8-oxo-dGTP diphosphatase